MLIRQHTAQIMTADLNPGGPPKLRNFDSNQELSSSRDQGTTSRFNPFKNEDQNESSRKPSTFKDSWFSEDDERMEG